MAAGVRTPGKAIVVVALAVIAALYLTVNRQVVTRSSPSPTVPPAGGAAVGDPNEMLQAAMEHTGRTVSGDIPIAGPVPTCDPSTWLLVDPGFLMGALAEVDSRPATTLTAEQTEECLSFIDDYSRVCERVNSSEKTFDQTFSRVLTPSQTRLLNEQRAVIERLPVDLRRLVESTRHASARTPVAGAPSAPESPSRQGHRRSAGVVRWPPTAYFVACLAFLETSQDPLSPEQAGLIGPALDALARDFEERASLYPRLSGLLSDTQRQELVRILGDIHAGRLDPGAIHTRPQQVAVYLRGYGKQGNVIAPAGRSPSSERAAP